MIDKPKFGLSHEKFFSSFVLLKKVKEVVFLVSDCFSCTCSVSSSSSFFLILLDLVLFFL